MNASARDGMFGHALSVYARGLAFMTATGLGIFALLCLYIAFRQQLLFNAGYFLAATHLAMILIILFVGRHDKPGTPEYKLTFSTFWIFYFIMCTGLISPVTAQARGEVMDRSAMPFSAIVLIMSVFWECYLILGLRAKWQQKKALNQ